MRPDTSDQPPAMNNDITYTNDFVIVKEGKMIAVEFYKPNGEIALTVVFRDVKTVEKFLKK